MSVNWDTSKYFDRSEFVCSHTGKAEMDGEFILIDRENAYNLLKIAFTVGFTGIGVNQKGGARFLHLDTIDNSPNRPRPTIWSY